MLIKISKNSFLALWKSEAVDPDQVEIFTLQSFTYKQTTNDVFD